MTKLSAVKSIPADHEPAAATAATAAAAETAETATQAPSSHQDAAPATEAGPDVDALQQMLTLFSEQRAPMLSRVKSVQRDMKSRIAELTTERTELLERRQLVVATAEALLQSFDGELADINSALELFANGLTAVDGAATVARAEN